MKEIFILLIAFQVKHFIADYPMQNEYMLGKMKKKGWVFPLTLHAFVHMCLTGVILSFYPEHTWLIFVDFVTHFTVDRIKASPNLLNRFKPDNKLFWWILGADQMAHHLTHYFIIWWIVK